MISRGLPVPRRTRDEIANISQVLRRRWNSDNAECFPILHVVEAVVSDGFEVRTQEAMGNNLGLTYPDQGKIFVRSDVYDAACGGKGWAREVVAHELGHFVLHRELALPFHRSDEVVAAAPLMEDSEWQANTFADFILAPLHISARMKQVDEIARSCGISHETAFRRWVEAKVRAY